MTVCRYNWLPNWIWGISVVFMVAMIVLLLLLLVWSRSNLRGNENISIEFTLSAAEASV